MSYTPLDDDKLVKMYTEENSTLEDMMRYFKVSNGTIYRHLRANGIESNRKTSIPWTDEENNQLIAARKKGLTGAEMYAEVPTRAGASIKSHVQKLRIDGRIER